MAARDGAASVQGDVIRITPLHDDGSIDTSKPVLTSEGFISASFSPEFEDGDEITEKAANGAICIQYKAPDSMKGITFNLSLCTPDPEAAALLAGGKVICGDDGKGGKEILGYSSPKVGATVGNPVAVEIWSKAITNGKLAAGTPYWHWVFPYVKVRFDGDREFSNGALANEFSGTGVGNDALVAAGLNPNVGGVSEDYVTYKAALDNPFSYVRSADKPGAGWTGSFVPTAANSIGCSGAPPRIAPDAPALSGVLADTTKANDWGPIGVPGSGVQSPMSQPPLASITTVIPADVASWDPDATGALPALPLVTVDVSADDITAVVGKVQALVAAWKPETDDAYLFLKSGTEPIGVLYWYDHNDRHVSPPGTTTGDPNGDTKFPFKAVTTVGTSGYFKTK